MLSGLARVYLITCQVTPGNVAMHVQLDWLEPGTGTLYNLVTFFG